MATLLNQNFETSDYLFSSIPPSSCFFSVNGILTKHFPLIFRCKLVEKFSNLLKASTANLSPSTEPGEFISKQTNDKFRVDEAFLGELLEGQLRPTKYQHIPKTPRTISS